MATKIQDGNVIDWENGTGADVAVGDVIDLTSRIGVALTDIANTETGAVDLEGVYEIVATTATQFVVGDAVYWDGTALTKTNTDTPAGTAVTAKAAATAGNVNVRIG